MTKTTKTDVLVIGGDFSGSWIIDCQFQAVSLNLSIYMRSVSERVK